MQLGSIGISSASPISPLIIDYSCKLREINGLLFQRNLPMVNWADPQEAQKALSLAQTDPRYADIRDRMTETYRAAQVDDENWDECYPCPIRG